MKIQIGKKEKTVILIALLSFVFAIFISTWVVVTLFVFYVLIVFFLYLNWLLKKTNWWKNQFVLRRNWKSFCSGNKAAKSGKLLGLSRPARPNSASATCPRSRRCTPTKRPRNTCVFWPRPRACPSGRSPPRSSG